MKFSTIAVLALLFAAVALPARAFPAVDLTVLNRQNGSSPSAEPSVSPEMSPEMSPDMSPEESPEDDDDVCVSESYLLSIGHSRRDFVHADAPIASVLCPADRAVPCATKHHMLRVDGRALSYEQYCETVACSSRIEKVNSVYSHIWQERDLGSVHLTMFDARYHELPQKALHMAMSASRAVLRSE